MPNFVRVNYQPLPEIEPPDFGLAPEMTADAYDHRLPAFILRQAYVRHIEDEPPSIPLSSSRLAIGGCISIITRRMVPAGGEWSDYGPHRDDISGHYPAGGKLIGLHATTVGSAKVSLIPALPHVETDALPLLDSGSPLDNEYRARYLAGEADADLFDPLCFTATLYEGDVLVKLDDRSAHDVITLGDMRWYSSGLYPATPQ